MPVGGGGEKVMNRPQDLRVGGLILSSIAIDAPRERERERG